ALRLHRLAVSMHLEEGVADGRGVGAVDVHGVVQRLMVGAHLLAKRLEGWLRFLEEALDLRLLRVVQVERGERAPDSSEPAVPPTHPFLRLRDSGCENSSRGQGQAGVSQDSEPHSRHGLRFLSHFPRSPSFRSKGRCRFSPVFTSEAIDVWRPTSVYKRKGRRGEMRTEIRKE